MSAINKMPEQISRLRVLVDLNRCQGYAQCCFLAPHSFELHGEEALWYDPMPDEALREQILRAKAACPVQAISVEYESSPSKNVEIPRK